MVAQLMKKEKKGNQNQLLITHISIPARFFYIANCVQSFYSLEGFMFVSKSANVLNHTPKMEKGHDF
jgi:hypothetical protein